MPQSRMLGRVPWAILLSGAVPCGCGWKEVETPVTLLLTGEVAPTGLIATAVSASTIELSWSDNAVHEDSYDVEWRPLSVADYGTPVAVAADTQTYGVTGLAESTEYVFRVAARNPAGLSGYSNEAHATTVALVDCSASNKLCVDDQASAQQEFSTIQAAVDAAVTGDAIYVRAGLYREEVTIVKDDIVLSAYPGEEGQAVIAGTQPVSGWGLADVADLDGNPNAANIYVAQAPCEVRRLFQNGEELTVSRYPYHASSGESRYLHISSADSATAFASDEINGVGADGHFNVAVAHIRINQWSMGAARVASSTATGGVVLQNAVPGGPPNVGYGFFFTQVVGAIAANGEWAWRDNELYVMADAVPVGVEASCRDTGIRVNSSVEDVAINGFTIRYAQNDCVRVEAFANQGVTISNNTLVGCGEKGISVQNGGGPVTIVNNEIADVWGRGIDLHQTTAPHVEGNEIHEVGARFYDDDVLTVGGNYQGTGILLIDGANAVITENRITNIAYIGILAVNYGGPSSNRTVSFNYVKDAMLGLNDGGCIYFHVNSNATPPRDMVGHNIVEHCVGSYLGTTVASGYYPQGVGIYIDNGTDTGYVDVENNTAAFNPINIFLHDTRANRLANNVLYATAASHSLSNLFIKSYCTYAEQENELDGNVLVSTDAAVYALRHWRSSSDCGLLTASDNNVFGALGNPTDIRDDISTVSTFHSLTDWRTQTGFDGNSRELAACTSSRLLTNPSMQAVVCTNLTGCQDVFGVVVPSSMAIEAFGSAILCECDGEPSCGP